MARHRLPKCLPGNEPARLLACAKGTRGRLIVLLGLYCGLRVSEIAERRIEDVDLNEGILQVRRGKGDKDRTVPIPSKVLPLLKAYIECRAAAAGWLFPGRGDTGHLTARAIQLQIDTAARRASLARHVTPSMMRHSYATGLLRSGADIIEVRDLLGHASIATTQVYLSALPERLRSAVERLN